MATTFVRYQARRNPAAAWTAGNEVLLVGEPGYESDTGKVKFVDGTTGWTALPYIVDTAALDGKNAAEISAKDPQFGAKGDGTNDDTAALQAFFTSCVNNGKSGVIPDGLYRITAPITT